MALNSDKLAIVKIPKIVLYPTEYCYMLTDRLIVIDAYERNTKKKKSNAVNIYPKLNQKCLFLRQLLH